MTRHRCSLLFTALLAAAAAAAPVLALDGDAAGVAALARLSEGLPYKVVVIGPIAYVGLDTGLATFDVSNAADPVRLGHLYLPGPALDVAVQGNYAYVADGDAGLQAVDVSDPTRPALAGSLAAPGADAVAVSGSLAYVGQAAHAPEGDVFGVLAVDVSRPTGPAALGFVPLPNGVLDVVLAGSVAWAATGSQRSGSHGLYAIDLSQPGNPARIAGGFLATPRPVNEVALSGSVAFLATGLPSTGALVAVNVANPAAPALLSSTALGDAALAVALRSGLAAVAASSLGLLTFDVANPAAPRPLDALATDRTTTAAAWSGDVVLLAERASIESAGLTAVDALDPGWLRQINSTPYAEATAVAATTGRAYFLRRDALEICDLTRPQTPVLLSTWSPPRGDYSALAVQGNLAAVAEGSRVHLVDLTDATSPSARGSVTVSRGGAIRLLIDGGTLHVVTGYGLELFDVTNPAAPAPLGTVPTAGWSSGLAVAGGYGYLVAGDTLHVLDLAAPALPVEIASLTMPVAGEQLFGIDAAGARAVATGYLNRLYVLDLADPRSPQVVGTLAGGTGFDVRLVGTNALIAAAESGLTVADISDPTSPAEIGFYDTSGTAAQIAADGNTMLLATVAAQHWVMSCTACPQTCFESWPTIAANSLRFVKGAAAARLSWQIGAGIGSTNVHDTTVKSELGSLASLAATLAGVSAATSYDDTLLAAPGAPRFYQVLGRGSCTGQSQP